MLSSGVWIALGSALSLCCEPLDIRLFEPLGDAGPLAGGAGGTAAGLAGSAGAAGGAGTLMTEPEPEPDAGEPPQPSCLPGATLCEACVSDAACAANLRCHPWTGECVAPCDADSPQCPSPTTCNFTRGVCVTCASNSDCESFDDRERCDELRGVCVECLDDRDCAGDDDEPVCLPGLSVCGCDGDEDCPADEYCELEDLRCEELDDD